MKRQQKWWNVIFLSAAIAAFTTDSSTRGQEATEDEFPLPPPPSLLNEEPMPFTDVPPELNDPAFNTHVDLKILTEAYLSLDASAMTDVALQLLEGERVLQRSHKALRPVAIADAALKIASDRGDTATIDRLAKLAVIVGDQEFGERVTIARQLAAAPRAIPALPPVEEGQQTEEEVVQSHQFMSRLDKARAIGDTTELKVLQEELKPLPKKEGSLLAFVDQQVNEAVAATENDSAGLETAALLRRLTATSRGTCEGPYQEGSVSKDGKKITVYENSKMFYIDTGSDKIYFPGQQSWGWVPRNSAYGLSGRFGRLDIRTDVLTADDGKTYQVHAPNGKLTMADVDYVKVGTKDKNGKFTYAWTGMKDAVVKFYPSLSDVPRDANPIVAAGGGNITVSLPPNMVAAGGGNIVAAGGGNIVAAGGGNVIDGKTIKLDMLSNMVAAGGGNITGKDQIRLIGKGGAGWKGFGLLNVKKKSDTPWRKAPRM